MTLPDGKTSLLSAMQDVGIRQYSEAHLDPYLSSALVERPWPKGLGQCSTSMSALSSGGLCPGSIMLFFGWFKEIRQKDNGHYEYSDHARIGKDGAHIIYGYLVVGSIDPVASIKDKLLDHPHTAAHYEDSFDNNTYITAASCGLFKYHENLVLSKPRHQKSIWKLPDNFKDVQFKYLVNTGTPDHCQAPYRGQELIAMSHQQEMHEWASDLIKAHTNS